ncbi:MAG: oligosaccharide flippase family protein [bacterium]|nr:oligosaccharide flippase family protein [bacterium]
MNSLFSKFSELSTSFTSWLSKKYKIDIAYILRGGLWQSAGQIVGIVVGLTTSIAFANLLPKETFGIYSYILSIAGLLSIFTLTGMDAAITQSVARGYEGSVVAALVARMRWGFIGSLASSTIAIYYFSQNQPILGYAILLLAIFIPIMDPLAIFYDVLKGRKQFDIDARYSIIVQVTVAALIISTLFLTSNILIILSAYFLSYTLTHFIILRRMISKYPLNKQESPDMIPYGKSLTLVRAITSVAAYLDKILLFNYISPVEVAIYSLAIAPVRKIEGFLGTIPTLALPKFSAYSKEELKKLLLGKVLKFSIVILIIIAIYVLIAQYFYQILFPKYMESIFYSKLFSLTLIGFPLSLIYTYFQSQTLTKIIFPYKIIIHAIQIILLFIFIHFYGILGAILARIAGQIIGIPIILLFFKKS